MKSKALKQNKDFRRLYYRGKSTAQPTIVAYAMKNRLGQTKVGITTGKKIGGAVERNRARRVIRAAFSEFENDLCGNYNIVFVARTKTTQVKMQIVRNDMEKALKTLGVIK